jgi:peptidyl-prolyl cis-trans isomerase C
MLAKIISGLGLCALLLMVVSCSAPQGPASEEVVQVVVAEPAETDKPEPQQPKAEPTVDSPDQAEPQPLEVVGPQAPQETDQPPDSNAPEVVISLGDKELTMLQVEWRRPNPPDYDLVKLANSWIETELLYEEAEKRGLTDDPQVQFLAEINRKMVVGRVLRTRVQAEATVSDEDVRAYYEKNKGTNRVSQRPGSLSFTHIRTRSLEEARKVLARLKAGEDINGLAKELSIYRDAVLGGTVKDAPYKIVERGFGEDFLEDLTEAEQGQLVGPIELEKELGFEVVRKDGETKPTPMPFEDVKARLRASLEQVAGREAFMALVKSLVEQAGDRIAKSQRLLDAEKTSKERPQQQRGPRTMRRVAPSRSAPGRSRVPADQ